MKQTNVLDINNGTDILCQAISRKIPKEENLAIVFMDLEKAYD